MPPPVTVAAARRRHGAALLRYATDLLDGDRVRAERVLVQAWDRLGGVGQDGLRREACFAVVRREALAVSRAASAFGNALAEDKTDVVEGSRRRETAAAARARFFASLTRKQQEVLRLHFVHGCTLSQIAEITELAPANVAQLFHLACRRALRQLRLRRGVDPDGAPDDITLTLAAVGEADIDSGAARNRAAGADAQAELRAAVSWLRAATNQPPRPARRAAALKRWWPAASLAIAATIVALAVFWPRPPATENRPSGAIDQSPAADPPRELRIAVQQRRGESPPPGASMPNGVEVTSLGIFRPSLSPTPPPAEAHVTERPGTPVGGASPRSSTSTDSPVSADAATGARALTDASRSSAPDAAGRGALSPGAEAAAAIRRGAREETIAAPVDSTDVAPIVALRRALGEARWPRPEEIDLSALRRHFATAVEAPDGLSFRREHAVLPWAPERTVTRIAVRAGGRQKASRPPANVVFLLDVSGSMSPDNRLPLVQESVAALLDLLGPQDRVGLVTYAGEARVVHPLAPIDSRGPVRAAVAGLEARGQTNGGAGLAEAYAQAAQDAGFREHIVILCTDGDFNVGTTRPEDLAEMVEEHARRGVRLAIFGFGRNGAIDPRLEALAAQARGGSGYVNTRQEAVAVLARQLDPLFAPVAHEVELLLGDRRIAGVAALWPGEILDALIEDESRGGASLRFRPDSRVGTERHHQAIGEPGAASAAGPEFWFSAIANELGQVLKEGPVAAGQLAELRQWTQRLLPDDTGGYRHELLALIEQAQVAAGVR